MREVGGFLLGLTFHLVSQGLGGKGVGLGQRRGVGRGKGGEGKGG